MEIGFTITIIFDAHDKFILTESKLSNKIIMIFQPIRNGWRRRIEGLKRSH